MDQITLQVLIQYNPDMDNYHSMTTYELWGCGDNIQKAKESAISVISAHLYHFAKNNVDLPLPEQQLKNAQEISDYFNADDPFFVKRREKKEKRKYVPGQEVTHIEGFKDEKGRRKLLEYSFKDNLAGELARLFLNHSGKRADLPERTYVTQDETIVVPADGQLPQLIF